MEYLFQYRVTSNNITCPKPVTFNNDGIKFVLYLHDKKILTNSKKLHVICSDDNVNKAYEKIQSKRVDFQERLIFFKGEKIFINELELVLIAQPNNTIRDMFVQGVKTPQKFTVDESYFHNLQNLIDMKLKDNEKLALHHFDVAIIEDVISDKFRALYLVLEDLIESKKTEVKCDKCQAILQCPKGHGPKIYSSTKKEDIKKLLKEIEFPETDFIDIDADKIVNFRQKLFHSLRRKGGFLNKELIDLVHHLSLKLRFYFNKRFGIYTSGGSVIESTIGTLCWYKFKAKNIKSKFEFDLPTLKELNENPNTENWWIDGSK